jgi:hypothetical protein
MDKAALLGAYVLMLGGYVSLAFSAFVLFTYLCSHFVCILATPEPGWEWECAKQSTQETLTHYLEITGLNYEL